MALCSTPQDKIKEMFKQCMLPSNVEGLHPLKLNSIVYEKLKGSFRVNDQHLPGLNTFLAQGLGLLASVWDKILKWETAMCNKTKVNVSRSLGVLPLENLSLNLTDMKRQLDRAIKLLATAHCVIHDRKRVQLCPFFDTKFHYLLKPGNPITSELLGDNVDQKVAEASKISEAAQRLQLLSCPFNRQGRFCVRFQQNRHGSGQGFRCPFLRREEYKPHFHQNYNSSYSCSHRSHSMRYNSQRYS